MDRLTDPNVLVLVGYLLAVLLAGSLLARQVRGTEDFVAGGRSMPGWAIGLSMFGSYVSSISFLANPAKAFAGDWLFLVFTLVMPVAVVVAVRWFVPFYRRSGHVSAYQHLEDRFGPWARTYAVACFLLVQMARNGTIVYLLALAVGPLVRVDEVTVIVVVGALMAAYTAMGGMRAVVWVGAAQSLVLLAGPIICLVAILRLTPGGAGAVMQAGTDGGRFGLGSFDPSFARPTFWLLAVYGLFIHLSNLGVDQGYVQRYITARDDRAARDSVWLTVLLYVPTATAFFFIGTALSVLHAGRPDVIPAGVAAAPDKVLPYFIAHHLPAGLSGLVVASIVAASMDTSLNSMATLTLCDLYKRYLRPRAGERESMAVLHGSTLAWGGLAVGVALSMRHYKQVLDRWWELAGLLAGGVLGLFLLGMVCRRARSVDAAVGVAAAVPVVVFMWLPPDSIAPEWLADARRSLHSYMTIVLTSGIILVAGLLTAVMRRSSQSRPQIGLEARSGV